MRLPSWKFKNNETEIQDKLQQETAWPDMFANLQSAYAELTNAQFELERRASEIAETRDLVQQIISSMSEALFLTDRAGRVVRANPAAAALLGCSEEAILGRLLSVVCNNEELPATPWKLMEMANGGRSVTLDVDVRPPEGTVIPVSFSLTLMHDKQDKITGVLAVARDMRQQRHLIDSLVSARTRFQELLEFAPDAIVLANQEGNIVLINSQTEKLFGYNREALLGQSVELLVPERYRKKTGEEAAASSGADANLSDLSALLEPQEENRNALILRNADERAQQIEFYVLDAHGREFLTEITQRPIVTEDGLLLMSVIRDISERQRIQQELHNSEGRHRALAETAQDVILTMDADRTIRFVNSASLRVFGYRPEELIGKSVSLLLPHHGQAEAGRQPVTTGKLRQAESRQETMAVRKDGGEVLVEISNSQFKQQGQVLYTAFIRDITERRRIEVKLRESEERYRNVALTAAEAIFTVDDQVAIQFANPAMTRVFGYTPEELAGQPLTLLLPAQEKGDSAAELKHYLTTGEKRLNWSHIEVPALHKDGHEIQIELSFSEFKREERHYFTGIIRDITERRRMEQQIQESEERYRNVALTAGEAIVTVDDEDTIQFANPAVARVFGHEAQALLGRNVTELMPTYDQHIHKATATNGTTKRGYDWQGVELRGLHRDGREVALEVSFNEFTREGKRLRTGIIRDISERKLAEEKLRLNMRALEASAFPILIADAQAPDMPLIYVNPAFERTTGYSAAEVRGKNCRFLQGAEREQPGLVELRAALNEGRDCTITLRNYRKDGTLFWNELTVSPVRDAQGAVTHFVGFENDITAKKKAEQAVLEATAVQRAILDFASYAIIATTPDGVITTFNPAAEKLLGYHADELIGQQSLVILHDPSELAERAQTLAEELEQRLAPGFDVLVAKARLQQSNESEWTYLRKDGARLPVNLSVSALRDAQGELTGYLAIANDITERRRAQERFTRQTALRLALSEALADVTASPQQLLAQALEIVVEKMQVELARCWLRDEKSGELDLQASAGTTVLAASAVSVPSQATTAPGRIGQIAQARKPLLSNSAVGLFEHGDSDSVLIELDTRPLAQSEQELAEQAGLNSFAGYPLLAGERLLGVLAIYARQPFDADVLSALGAASDTLVLGLERQRAQEERARLQAREAARANQHAALRIEISSALNQLETTLPEMLQGCAHAVVSHLDAAFARVWLVNDSGDTLELQASAGLYTHTDGAHQFVPLGQFKIGLIAEEKMPHLTNDVLNDPRVGDKEWAAREGLSAFAGYPLLSQGKLLGVLAMFARHELKPDTLNALAAVADQIVLGVERRKAEAARAALLANEQAARREAEEASRLKDDFLAMISHELRAPLTAILGWAQMLRAGTMDRTAAERALATIERNAKSQAHLVGDLLDASRIATGKLRLDKKPCELRELIDAAIDAIRPSVEAKSLRLQVVMEPWVGPFEGDPERMKQIVWNLLSNAVKFTPPAGLIEVRLEKMEDRALLIVSDTGQGIEPEFLPYVFERFRQSDSSTKRQHGGLGLGLAIVKSLVEMHGGAIYAYSAGKDQGTDFMVTLPLATPNAETTAQELWAPNAETLELRGGGSLRGVRVLVVDDERDTREILSVMLGRFGAEVRTGGSVAEGLRTLKSWRPDLLVSDIGMPVEDGYVFITKLRALAAEEGGATPALALTAFASSQDRQKALESGFQVHLAKPIEPVELARMVARTLGRSEAGIEL
ncbi:MAG: PAS domain S-box protein [Acidobacteria bacterium]|nr:PAS domain S-box protein [Acidobacteriota bacterium]